jgi:hypothetical protein
MLLFTSRLKLYLFKNKNKVSLSIKVSDNCVNGFLFDIDDFEKIIGSWKKPGGFETQIDDAYWLFMHKQSTPRPECAKTSYVRISVHPKGPVAYHYRVSYEDMYNLEKDYFYQKNNEMYWDNDV